MDNTTADPVNIANIADTVEVAIANSPPSNCITQLEIQVKELNLALAADSNEEEACNLVLEEHLQRQRMEDSRTMNWQRRNKLKWKRRRRESEQMLRGPLT